MRTSKPAGSVRAHALQGALIGGLVSLLPSAWVLFLMLLNWSTSVPLRRSYQTFGPGAIAVYVTIGIVGGAGISALRHWMRNRLVAYCIGVVFGTIAAWLGLLTLTHPDKPSISFTASGLIVASIFGVTVGGVVGLESHALFHRRSK